MCKKSLKQLSLNKKRRNSSLTGTNPVKAKSTYAAIRDEKIKIAKRMTTSGISVEVIALCLSVTNITAQKYINK